MQTEYLIAIDEFCVKHDIEVSFINSLQKTGLIDNSRNLYVSIMKWTLTSKVLKQYLIC